MDSSTGTQALLDAAIFFDFRAVAGNSHWNLWNKSSPERKSEKRFLAHMLSSALAFRPPLGFFNRLRSEDGKVDLKKGGIAAIVGLARAAALAAGSRERSTLERLEVARASGAVLESGERPRFGGIVSFLAPHALARSTGRAQQKTDAREQRQLGELSTIERRHLREASSLSKTLRKNCARCGSLIVG